MNSSLTKKSRSNFDGLDVLRRNMTRVFDDFFSLSPSSLFEREWLPSIDVDEDDKEVHVKAEMPGIDEKNLNVTIEDNVLTISGEKKEERKEEDKKTNYIFSERKFGSFSRTISLPDSAKAEEIKATFKKGILTIDIPKAEVKEPKKINVNVN